MDYGMQCAYAADVQSMHTLHPGMKTRVLQSRLCEGNMDCTHSTKRRMVSYAVFIQ